MHCDFPENGTATTSENSKGKTSETKDTLTASEVKSFDVICGRCSLAFNNVGNRRFRVIIGMNLQRYIDAHTRAAKGRVIQSVVKIFQEQLGARFVKQNKNGDFVPVSEKVVRQKVGHALRDLAAQRSLGAVASTHSNGNSSPVPPLSPPTRRAVSLDAIRRCNSLSPTPMRARSAEIRGVLDTDSFESSSSDDSASTDSDQTTQSEPKIAPVLPNLIAPVLPNLITSHVPQQQRISNSWDYTVLDDILRALDVDPLPSNINVGQDQSVKNEEGTAEFVDTRATERLDAVESLVDASLGEDDQIMHDYTPIPYPY